MVSHVKRFVPVILVCGLVLTACSSDTSSTESTEVERGASNAQVLTLCVDNQSSRSISSAGNGSPSQPEGFLVRPGERACASAAPNYGELNQKMMSDTGPAWDTRLGGNFTMGKAYSFSTCGNDWTNRESFSRNITCSGNPFRIEGLIKVDSDRQTIDAEIKFLDQ